MVADGGRGFDVISIDTSLFKRYYDNDLIRPVNLDNISNYSEAFLKSCFIYHSCTMN